jgi:hypothetical protein
MKRVIIGMVLALVTAQTASAFDLESPRGISQDQWNKSNEYQNFQCPANTARGEGVDMNFTTNRADDFYFVTCTPVQIPTKIEIVETATVVTPITTPPVQPGAQNPVLITPVETKTVVSDTKTAVIETTTANVVETATVQTNYARIDWETVNWATFDWEEFLTWLKAYIEEIFAVKP